MEVASRHLVAPQLQIPATDLASGNLVAPLGRNSGHVFCRTLCSKLRCAVCQGQASPRGRASSMLPGCSMRTTSTVAPVSSQGCFRRQDRGMMLVWLQGCSGVIQKGFFLLTATWSFIQKTREWTHLCPLKRSGLQDLWRQ